MLAWFLFWFSNDHDPKQVEEIMNMPVSDFVNPVFARLALCVLMIILILHLIRFGIRWFYRQITKERKFHRS